MMMMIMTTRGTGGIKSIGQMMMMMMMVIILMLMMMMKMMMKKIIEDAQVKKREHWSTKNKTGGVKDDTNWAIKRGEERAKLRRGEERADWIFERAKHRK